MLYGRNDTSSILELQICTGCLEKSLTFDKKFEHLKILLGIRKKRAFKKVWLLINSIKLALWKVRNIYLFKKEKILVEGYIRLGLSFLYIYYLRDITFFGDDKSEKYWNFEIWNRLL